MIHVRTYKGDNGKRYVEVTGLDNYNGLTKVGWRLDAGRSVSSADFIPPTPGNDCGFASRRVAREYIAAYNDDCGDVVGGLH